MSSQIHRPIKRQRSNECCCMHQSSSLCRAALARSKGWAPRPAAKVPLPISQPSGGSAAPDAAMQPLPWSDPSLRFSSAPVVNDEHATEELQAPSAAALADREDTGATEVQQEVQVCAVHDQFQHTQNTNACMTASVCCVHPICSEKACYKRA